MMTRSITYKVARRVVIAIAGMTVLILGVVMLVTPGPAILVIPAGLAILGLEFAWARVWLKKMRAVISRRNANDLADRAESHRKK